MATGWDLFMKKRLIVLWRIARGLLAAIAVTLVGMLLLAAAILYLGLGDQPLTLLNQLLKLLAILVGVRVTVGRGGEHGLAKGAVTAGLYMVLGYAASCALGGLPFSASGMLLEIAAGVMTGGLFGMLLANLHPRERKLRPARRRA